MDGSQERSAEIKSVCWAKFTKFLEVIRKQYEVGYSVRVGNLMNMWCDCVLMNTTYCSFYHSVSCSYACLHNVVYIIFWRKLQKRQNLRVLSCERDFFSLYLCITCYVNRS